MEGLRGAHLLPAEAEARRSQLVEIARIGLLLLGQHAAFARADAGADEFGAAGQRHLGRCRERTEAHVRDDQRYRQPQRPLRVRPDDDIGADGVIVEQRRAVQLGGKDLDVVPARQLVARHAHRVHHAMVAGLGKAVARIALNQRVVRLFRRAVAGVGIGTQVAVAVEGLRVGQRPGADLVGVDPHLAVVDPGRELGQHLGVVVSRDAAVEAVVPVVQAADEVVALHMTVGQQRAAMQAAAVEHRHRSVVSDDHQIDPADHCMGRLPVSQFIQTGNRNRSS